MGWRKSFINGSRSVDMIGRIHADLFFQDRYILNEVNVKIKFIRNRDTFSLIEEHENRIIIESAILYVRKVKLSSAVFLPHAKALEDPNAKYPVRRVVCKSVTVAVGFRDVTYEKLFSGQLPNRIIVGMVRNDAFSASKDHNPFNFEHYNVNEISVYADGQNVQNMKPLTMNFGGGQCVQAYNSLFTGTRRMFFDEGLAIDRVEYKNRYVLYVFNQSPDLTNDEKFELLRTGSVRLQIKFANETPHAITIIVYGEYQNLIEIDRNRNVIYYFTA